MRRIEFAFVVAMLGCAGPVLESEVIDPQDELGMEALGLEQVHQQFVLFNGGTEGHHSYRIPSLIRTTEGTLIAFAEGRKDNNEDFGNINLVYKRSTNNGQTWSGLRELVGVGPGTWGNPTAVVDTERKRIWVFMSWNAENTNQFGTHGFDRIDKFGERRVYTSHSDDDGLTWTKPQDLTHALLPPGYTWDAVGPGVGIQSRGKLIIPANGRFIHSNNGGASWTYTRVPGGTSESTVVELKDGQLLRNDRAVTDVWKDNKHRRVTRGTLEGGFGEFRADEALVDPKCQASVLRYTGEPSRILFLNPASTEDRCRMRVRVSYDEGKTWPIDRGLDIREEEGCRQGQGGYSSMVKTSNFRVGALVETNEDMRSSDSSHRSIEFHLFNLPWILDGRREPRTGG